jgi:hypothetical protein
LTQRARFLYEKKKIKEQPTHVATFIFRNVSAGGLGGDIPPGIFVLLASKGPRTEDFVMHQIANRFWLHAALAHAAESHLLTCSASCLPAAFHGRLHLKRHESFGNTTPACGPSYLSSVEQ